MLDMTLDEVVKQKPKKGKGSKKGQGSKGEKKKTSLLDGPLVTAGRRKGKGKGKGQRSKGKGKGKGQGRWIKVNSYQVLGVKKKGKKILGNKIAKPKGEKKEAASNGFSKAKLEMSLEDVISKEKPGGKGNKKVIQTKFNKKAKGGGKGGKGKGKKLGKMSRQMLSRAKAWAAWGGYGGGKGKGRSKGKGKGKSKGKSKGKGKDRGWSRAPVERRRAFSDKGRGKGGREWSSLRSERGSDRYGGKGSDRGDRSSSWGKGGGRRDDGWSVQTKFNGGASKGGRGRSRSRMRDDYPRRAPEMTRSRSVGGGAGGKQGATTIKVSGIPRGLDWRDIKDAFQDAAGKVIKCDMEGSTAWLAFTSPRDAQKAVKTFDHGELNGKTITVVLVD